MKKTTLIIIVLTFSTMFTKGQTIDKQKEIGLIFSSLNNFGITYKTGTKEALWRFSTLFIKGSDNSHNYSTWKDTGNSFGNGIRIGKEKRKNIAKNLDFRYGFDLTFSYYHEKTATDNYIAPSNNQTNITNRYSPGMNLLIGINYWISEKFVMGAEILPYFNYSYSKFSNTFNSVTTYHTAKGINYGLTNQSALITIAYKF
jgi:hypothetical protein